MQEETPLLLNYVLSYFIIIDFMCHILRERDSIKYEQFKLEDIISKSQLKWVRMINSEKGH